MRTSTSTGEDSKLIDKNPVYRTHDIFNGVFKKKVRLQVVKDNGASKTNCKGIIWLNFNQPIVRQIEELAYKEGDRNFYHLSCDHLFRSGKGTVHAQGRHVPCFACGSNRVYRTLEHEWSHIIFKSNPHLYKTFVDQYIQQLSQEGYQSMGLDKFFHDLINAFDDIRVNSLLHHVYEGAAYDIWQKWREICEEDDEFVNGNFLALIFGATLGAGNVDYDDGEFSKLIPIMKEAGQKVKGKGPGNMLLVVRWFMDRCIRQMLNKEPPKQNQPDQDQDGQQGGQGQDQQGQSQAAPSTGDAGDQQGQSSAQGDQDDDDSQQQDGQQGQPQAGQQSQGSEGGDKGQQGSSSVSNNQQQGQQKLQHGPPIGHSAQDTKDKNTAMQTLRKSSSPLTSEEDYHVPDTSKEPDANKNLTAAAAAAALRGAVDDDDQLDAQIQSGTVDQDVQQAVDQLKNTVRTQTQDSNLLSNAKAKILLLDVKPGDILSSAHVKLSTEQKSTVNRMRAAFTKVMGKKQTQMNTDGTFIDVESVIQFMVDPTEDEVFEEEQINKGFAYLILCDMSGSMHGDPFNQVCNGAEMLKKALDYPFVQGEMWGFRGAMQARSSGSMASQRQWIQTITRGGEIWIYRYAKGCQGYLGEVRHPKAGRVSVTCNGLTPMNSAIHVALKYLMVHVPAGMAKRLFILTDGNPTHTRTDGGSLSNSFLRKMVAKEIREGRQKGVDTFSFVIGPEQGVSDKNALEMFGPRRFWDRVDGDHTIDDALIKVIRTNFVKYLKGA